MKLYKIKKSKIDKNGLYASRDIKKGTKLLIKIISTEQTKMIQSLQWESNLSF